jgi:TRAP-type C4-dicarboxylate transport system substrate-binding protein
MNEQAWERLPGDIQDIILNRVMPEMYDYTKNLYRVEENAALEAIEQNVETMHWVTAEDAAPYYEYLPTHSLQIVQTLMIDPQIVQIIEDFRPSARQ